MTCPNCGTLNDPQSRFCIKCGQSLAGTATAATGAPGPAPAYPPVSYRRLLAIHTAQALTGVVVLYVFRSLLTSQLTFLDGLRLPDVPLSAGAILNLIVNIGLVVLLVRYAQALAGLWPPAFPGAAALAPVVVALVGVTALVVGYDPVAILLSLALRDRTGIQVVQALVLLVALGLLIWAGLALYRFVPAWVAQVRFARPLTVSAQVACLRCGRVNTGEVGFCGQCGSPLPTGTAQTNP